MQYKMSANTAVFTDQPEAALEFYRDVMGFSVEDTEWGPILDTGVIKVFIDSRPVEIDTGDASPYGLVLEFVVDDVEAAREELTAHGCKVFMWEGAGQACVMRDPFGLMFNLWQGA